MKQVGIQGAYLVCISDTSSKVPFEKPVRQLTPEWWSMVNHAMRECKRLGLQLAYHVSDGFALAGGPWITPKLSMQKIVWSKTYVKGALSNDIMLEQPTAKENFYQDIAVFAYPAQSSNAFGEIILRPLVTTSNGQDASFLYTSDEDSKTFRSDSTCWIQYKYENPFTLRSLKTHTGGNNYQSQRLIVLASDDGVQFDTVIRLQPPRHGWQDTDEDYTFSIPATTARYFRFVYDKAESEPGSEDLDAAKWKPTLKLKGIYLNDEPVINQMEAKNGSIWRVAENTKQQMVPDTKAVPFKSILNLTDLLDREGKLQWKPDSGNWVVVRIGHSSTGHTNATGGAAKGLECDKFNPEAIRIQFDNWFAKAFEKTDPGLAKEVLKIFYIDSWEAGSQNWSQNFLDEFKKRRGYDLMPYLLVMTGVPIDNASSSEKILHDVRQTIAELVNDIFYVTLRKLSKEKGCNFTAESVAPTMVSDGLLHYKTVDFPTGEFWLNSPTHDKPNDMFDAISAAHIYGKNIVQAEAFTTVRMDWTEHPGMLKSVGDRSFAMGINRFLFHVATHNPWMDRKPGMTLGTVGLFFQRDQTWFKQGKAYVDYVARTSALLQQGKPVADIAVFIGEEVPRRSVLPDRLVNTLPGIFGKEMVAKEKIRLQNQGLPQRTKPYGVSHSANMADPEDWTDALRGYRYDCFNTDALWQAKAVGGKMLMPSGLSYPIVVFPGKLLMNPNHHLMSLKVAEKILELKNGGVSILLDKDYKLPISFEEDLQALQILWKKIVDGNSSRVIAIPYLKESFEILGIPRDLDATKNKARIAWTHRKLTDGDIYFISNQENRDQDFDLSFRVKGLQPEIWDAVTGETKSALQWKMENDRTEMKIPLAANGSVFVIFRKLTSVKENNHRSSLGKWKTDISHNWMVKFDSSFGGPVLNQAFKKLSPWNESQNDSIKYYSGTVVYTRTFGLSNLKSNIAYYLSIDSLFNMATIRINGKECGTIWTKPYRLDVSKAIVNGLNKIEIAVTNTWFNRLQHDNTLPENKRLTWTTAPLSFMKDLPMQKAGLEGNIWLEEVF